jgi:RNase P subunit RPR2
MERGSRVRPTAEALERTQFRSSSRLRVALKRGVWPVECRSCGSVLLPGELYARGSEQTSALCLGCVEPVEEVAA